MRIDVAPGAPGLATYLDEEFGAEVSDLAPSASFLGGKVQSGCLTYPEDMCFAVWQGTGLFVALLLRGQRPVRLERGHCDIAGRAAGGRRQLAR